MYFRLVFVFVLVFASSVSPSAAQNCTTSTGYNSTLILPPDFSPSIDGEPAPDNTRIRVVTSGGECVAVLNYVSSSSEGQSAPIWGEDSEYNPDTGLSIGDTLHLEIQPPTSDRWHSASATYTDGVLHNTTGRYTHNERYVLGSLSTHTGPGASADETTIKENNSVTIDVLANDAEVTFVSDVTSPTHGSAVITNQGVVRYVPETDYVGTDSFEYTAASASGQTARGSVTVKITAVNDSPLVTSEAPTTATASETYSYEIKTTDGDGDAVEISAPTLPNWLSFADNGDGTGALAGTPTENHEGRHQVTIVATDGTSSTKQSFVIDVSVDDVVGPPPPHSVAFSRTVDAGWNLVGLPVEVSDSSRSAIFPHASPNSLYGYNGSLTGDTVMTRGQGYWLRSETRESVTMRGGHFSSVTVQLRENWNLVSPPSCAVPISAINDPDGIVDANSIYIYQGGYQPADTLKPAEGYWFRTTGAGRITLDCNSTIGKHSLAAKTSETALSKFSRLSIRDAKGSVQELYFNGSFERKTDGSSYSVPPIPPKGIFDVRFAGDRHAIDAASGTIQLQSSSYPVTIELSGAAVIGKTYVLEAVSGSEVVGTHTLTGANTVRITDSSVDQLRIASAEQITRETPDSFQLHGNYPNPFNPTTNIQFSLPEQAEVTLEVYNVTGARIMQLPARTLEAGQRTLTLDGSSLSSGIYLYRVTMQTASSVQTKASTMTLVK